MLGGRAEIGLHTPARAAAMFLGSKVGRGYFAGFRVTKRNKATVLLTLTLFQTQTLTPNPNPYPNPNLT
jgi:hypothetical protein